MVTFTRTRVENLERLSLSEFDVFDNVTARACVCVCKKPLVTGRPSHP